MNDNFTYRVLILLNIAGIILLVLLGLTYFH